MPVAAVLSQSEIEALLSAMTTVEEEEPVAIAAPSAPSVPNGGPAATRVASGKVVLPLHKRRRAAAEKTMAGASGSGSLSYEAYDFRRPDKLSKENLRSLQILHETFCNYLTSSLAGYLRAQVQIEVISVEQVPYEEYTKSVTASLLNILDVSPLAGQAILEVDFGILFSMMDRLLGGSGAAGKVMRDLTDIEKVLTENIIQLALNDLKTAWDTINPLDFHVASTDTSSQFVQIVPGNDTVALILFQIRMGEHQGAMSICIPYLLIKPILGKLSSQRWLTSARKPSPLHAAGLAQRLRTSRVACVARLGTASLSVDGLARLQVGQVLPMDVPSVADEHENAAGRLGTVDLLVGGQVKFQGRTGLRGKRLAVQIERVIAPPAELVTHKEIS